MKQLTKQGIIELIILSLFMVVCFPFLFISSGQSHTADAVSWTSSYKKPFGSGTAESPYTVSSAEELAYFVNYTETVGPCTDVIQLSNNIDLSGKSWDGIGNATNPFRGSFDGQGYRILNMESSVGLFGNINGRGSSEGGSSQIQNVVIEGSVNGSSSIAGIAGKVEGYVAIRKCVNFCSVTGNSTSGYVGGIVGYAYGTGILTSISIEECANYGEIVNRIGAVGGIAGFIYRSLIAYSVNNGNLMGTTAAGIVNYADTVLAISHCYNADVEINATRAAGIVYSGSNIGGIQSCFDLVKSIPTGVSNYYPITSTSGNNNLSNYKAMSGGSGSGTYLENIHTLAKTKDWYLNGEWNGTLNLSWDMDNMWFVNEGKSFPMLRHTACITLDRQGGHSGTDVLEVKIGDVYSSRISIPIKHGAEFRGYYTSPNGAGEKVYDFNGTILDSSKVVAAYKITLYASWGISQDRLWSTYYTIPAGAGTAASPYLVYTPNELAYFAFLTRTSVCSDVIQLKADIDLDGYYWEPIGYNVQFSGRFDGNGYVIKNIQVDVLSNAGLFGKVLNADIRNVYLQSGLIKGQKNLGGIVGVAANSQISNCINGASINGIVHSAENVGGIVGWAIGTGGIESCYNIGAVGGAAHVGGILGRYSGSADMQYLIKSCYVQGNVLSNAGHDVGGIVGSVETNGTFGVGLSFASATISLILSDSVDLLSVGGIIGRTASTGTNMMMECGYYGNIMLPSGVSAVAHNSMYGTFIGTISNSLGQNTSGNSVMVGTNFSNWGYSEYLNNGIPLPKVLNHALAHDNKDVYGYLISKGFVKL